MEALYLSKRIISGLMILLVLTLVPPASGLSYAGDELTKNEQANCEPPWTTIDGFIKNIINIFKDIHFSLKAKHNPEDKYDYGNLVPTVPAVVFENRRLDWCEQPQQHILS